MCYKGFLRNPAVCGAMSPIPSTSNRHKPPISLPLLLLPTLISPGDDKLPPLLLLLLLTVTAPCARGSAGSGCATKLVASVQPSA
jgi:hypothetical protein